MELALVGAAEPRYSMERAPWLVSFPVAQTESSFFLRERGPATSCEYLFNI